MSAWEDSMSTHGSPAKLQGTAPPFAALKLVSMVVIIILFCLPLSVRVDTLQAMHTQPQALQIQLEKELQTQMLDGTLVWTEFAV